MKTFSKILGMCFLFSSVAFAQDSQEVDDTYFFTTDRSIPTSIAKDARLKPVLDTESNIASKYANPDFNGDVTLNDQSFDYYTENPINDQYVFGSNSLYNNYGYGNSWGMNPYGAYSMFNDPFFSPYYPYASRMGMGFSPWGSRFGMNYGMGFGSMFGSSLAWGMGNRFYSPFNDPFMSPFNYGYGRSFYGNSFYNRPAIVVVERPRRDVTKRFNRGNAAIYSRTADNTARMANYRPSSDANRVASSRIRNVDQLQQRINNRNNGRLSNSSSANTSRNYNGRTSSFSSGRSSSNSRYNRNNSGFNSGRSSYNNNNSSFSSPSRSSFGGSSSGGSRSSAPVRRGRQ